MNTKTEERQIAVLLHVIGEGALEKYNTFGLSDADSKVFAKVVEAFESYCTPKANESVDRHIFFARTQQQGETFDLFLTDLKKLSAPCGFGDLREGLIRDRIISGLREANLKNRLLRENNLDLDKCVKICKASELTQQQLKTIDEDVEIHAMNRQDREMQKTAS